MNRQLTIAALLAVLLTCCSLFFYAHLVSERAQMMLRTAYELSDQKKLPTATEIRQRYGRRLQQLDGCTPSECGYAVSVSNRVLAVLRIAPYTEMKSYFWVRDGVVLENMVDYTTTVNRRYAVVSHVQLDFCKGCQTFAIHPWDAGSPFDTNGLVTIGNEAPAQSRRTVLSLDTGCLTRLAGCQSVADLLPTVWKKTADNKIACLIQNDRGFVQKPSNWP